MKKYFVKILVDASGYQLNSHILVDAGCVEEASSKALVRMTSSGLVDFGDVWLERDGVLSYRIGFVKELSASDAVVLERAFG